jgi:hypothetical protein
MLKKKKTVEIRLWEFHWKSPYVRVLKRYSHVVFRMVQPLRHGEANIMATLGREVLGPFGSAHEAYEAAEGAQLKLGMTVKELEVYMTRERKIRKGPRKGELETRIVPVVLFPLLDVHKTRDFECSDGTCNQAGFLSHKYIPKGEAHLETRFRYRRSSRPQRLTPPPLIAPPPQQRSAGTFHGRRRLGRAPVAMQRR